MQNEISSALTSLGLKMKDSRRRRRLREVRVLGEEDPILLATGYNTPSTASSEPSCLAAYYESSSCERVLNETFDNMTAQNDVKNARCKNANAGLALEKCQAEMEVLLVMQEIWQNQTLVCQNISQPCSGSMRGTCNVTSGECMCNADWIGLQCEIQPSAVYWDTECGCFKSDGCEVYGLDENGGALTGCTHLTEFGMMSETVEPPGMDGGVTLKVNLPKVMTLEELLETLADMKPLEFAIPGKQVDALFRQPSQSYSQQSAGSHARVKRAHHVQTEVSLQPRNVRVPTVEHLRDARVGERVQQ